MTIWLILGIKFFITLSVLLRVNYWICVIIIAHVKSIFHCRFLGIFLIFITFIPIFLIICLFFQLVFNIISLIIKFIQLFLQISFEFPSCCHPSFYEPFLSVYQIIKTFNFFCVLTILLCNLIYPVD